MLDDTAAFKTDSDIVGRFLDDKCYPLLCSTKSSSVYKLYFEWCKEEGHSPLSHVRLSRKMLEKGLPATKKQDGMYYPDKLMYSR